MARIHVHSAKGAWLAIAVHVPFKDAGQDHDASHSERNTTKAKRKQHIQLSDRRNIVTNQLECRWMHRDVIPARLNTRHSESEQIRLRRLPRTTRRAGAPHDWRPRPPTMFDLPGLSERNRQDRKERVAGDRLWPQYIKCVCERGRKQVLAWLGQPHALQRIVIGFVAVI